MSHRIAVIGMGQMGSGMAARLKGAGHDLIGYDINAPTRAARIEEGFAMAPSIAAAVAERDVVLSSLTDSAAVRAAWTGPGGIVESANQGTLLIELSTIDPATMREVGQAAAAKGLGVVDCPVSGSPKEAGLGKLVIIAGGEPSAIQRAQPIFKLLGETWRHTGTVGTAKVVKLVNNMMSMGNVAIAAEAFALGVAAGVEPRQLYEVLSVSGGRSHHFTKRFPNALAGNFEPGFKMELGEKDMGLAIDFARSLKMPTPAASMVRELMAMALAEGHRGRDIVALLEMYRTWAEAKGGVG
jgi:3-hydroxyisobutyrate dehydrogenase